MKEETKKRTYLSPSMEVTEIDAREMLCGSPMGEQGFGLSDDGQLGDGGDL